MYTFTNKVCTDNGVVVSTHESHWKAVAAMLAIPDDVRAVLEALPPQAVKHGEEPLVLRPSLARC